jgi:hypothetical protein
MIAQLHNPNGITPVFILQSSHALFIILFADIGLSLCAGQNCCETAEMSFKIKLKKRPIIEDSCVELAQVSTGLTHAREQRGGGRNHFRFATHLVPCLD